MSSSGRGEVLNSLSEGQIIPFGGDRFVTVDADLARSFRAGDRLIVVQESGDLIRVPESVSEIVDQAVSEAHHAASMVERAPAQNVDAFYEAFAKALEDETSFSAIAAANLADVESARARGRAIGRLELSPKMRADMVAALRMWRDFAAIGSDRVSIIEHATWTVEERRAALGVIGFVFEGRPNVFADATGVLRSGNTVVFRIGSDALRTAREIMSRAVRPALIASGLPEGAVALVDSPDRAAGHALFSDRRISLAVARGSGEAVAQLGAVARQSGVPVSLHGTGGAWLLIDRSATVERITAVVDASLDRKVCNTANVIGLPNSSAEAWSAVVAGAVLAAKRRRGRLILHCRGLDVDRVGALFANSGVETSVIGHDSDDFLATEWEWDEDPEISLIGIDELDEGVRLFNRYSPQFVISVVATDSETIEKVYGAANAPFVGDGFTRWVDGQYALGRPELGLSNWQSGRLFARGGILSGDGVFSVRYIARHSDPTQRR